MTRFAIAVVLLVFSPLYANAVSNVTFVPEIGYADLARLQAMIGYFVLIAYLGITGMRA